jgi:hypothetical protein
MMKYDEHCGTSYGVDGELMTVVDIMAQSATGQRVPQAELELLYSTSDT